MAPQNTQDDGQPGAAAHAPDPGQDFDAAVDEFLAPPSDPAHAAADADAGTEDGAADAPAPAPAAATPPAAGDDTPPAGSSTDDIWNSVAPEVRTAHENALRDAQLRLEGIKGRQSASDREVQRLREEIAQLKAGQGNGTPAPSQDAAPTTAPSGKVSADALRQLREDYPDVAGPLVDLIEDLSAKVGTLEQPVGDFQQQQAIALANAQHAALDAKFPGYHATITGDLERFQGWLSQQPRVLQDAQARNASMIVDAEEAALVVGKYYADLGIGASSAPAPAPAPKPDDRRQRQIAHGRDTGRTGPTVTTGIPDDLDAAIDYWTTR